MTYELLCAINVALLSVWLIILEVRFYRQNKAMGLMADSIKGVLACTKTNHEEIQKLKRQNNALIKAVTGNAEDIGQIILAVNRLSNEVLDDDMLQTPIKQTMQ